MHNTAIDAAARKLIEARASQSSIDRLGPGLEPTTVDEAYAIDDRVAELTGWPVAGWKVGCTSVASQELLGASGPFFGRIYNLATTDEVLPSTGAATAYIEGEFAFVAERTIPPRPEPFIVDEVLATVSELRPCIEIVGGRFTNFIGMPVLSIIADAGSNTHLILGEPAMSWAPADLPTHPATMAVDGKIVCHGSGHDVLENPVNSLLWLANHLAQRGIAIQPGQIISTGTATKVTELPAGSTATADFGTLGAVSTSYEP